MLTYTFPLLTLPSSIPSTLSGPSSRFAQPFPPNGNLVAHIQQELDRLGVQHHVVVQNDNAHPALPQPQARAVPVRALMTPLILMFLRTLLLLYFFSPARKPIFGLMLGAWVVYEAWGAIRGAIGDLNEPGRGADRGRGRAPAVGEGQADAAAGGDVPAGGPVNTLFRGPERNQGDAILTHVANINIQSEENALTSPEGARPEEEPGLAQKIKIFVSLLVLTLHPAVWNRRRAALKEREGRLKTEANAR